MSPRGSIVLAGALASLLIVTAWLTPSLGPGAVLGAYALCFVPYALLVRSPPSDLRRLLLCALAARLAVAFAEPVLSDDIFRYVWEGRVTLAGFNPFSSAPDAAELVTLRDAEIWPRINHREVSTIYPPVSQYFFALVAAVGGGTTVMRLGFVAVEALGAFTLWRLFPDRVTAHAVVVYALNPLIVLEVAWSGHLDVLAWIPLCLALAIVAWKPATLRWGATAGALAGLSIAAKFLGVLLAPYLLLRAGLRAEWRSRLAAAAIAALVVVGSYAGFADARGDLFRGFGTYAASWRNNDGMFRAFVAVSEVAMGDDEDLHHFESWDDVALEYGFTKQWEGQTLPNTTFTTGQLALAFAKLLAAFCTGVMLLWCVVFVREPFLAAALIIGTLYFCAPTVHPWYVAWLVPLAALGGLRTPLVFSVAVLVGYVSWWSLGTGGEWAIPWWAVLLEYGVVFAAFWWELARGRDGEVRRL